jgi:iron(III) transport system permease protein
MAVRVLFCVYLLLVYSPLAALLASAGPLSLDLSARRVALLGHTTLYAGAVSTLAMMIGVPAATFLRRRTRLSERTLVTVLVALVALPPYIHALAWNRILSPAAAFGGGAPAAVFCHAMALVPLSVLLSLLAFDAIPQELMDAARVFQSGGSIFRRVLLPLAWPTICAGASILFLLAAVDYVVPSLFSVPAYSLEIHAEFSTGGSMAGALGAAMPIACLCGMVLAISLSTLRRAALAAPSGSNVLRDCPDAMPKYWIFCEWMAAGLVAAHLLVPLTVLGSSLISPSRAAASVTAAAGDLVFSGLIALAVAAVGVPAAYGMARVLALSRRLEGAWWLAALLPAALPAPLAGVGLIALWHRPGIDVLYGTPAMVALAALARVLPFGALILAMALRRTDPLLEDAATIFEPSRASGWFRVRLPLVAPALGATAIFLAALSLGELGATLLVIPPGAQTLTLRIYNYLHYGESQAVGGLCLLMALLTAALGAAASASIWRRS